MPPRVPMPYLHSPRRSTASGCRSPCSASVAAEIYRVALPFATTLHLTEIAHNFDGDVRFPSFERNDWRETAREVRPPDRPGGFAYAYVTYERDRAGA